MVGGVISYLDHLWQLLKNPKSIGSISPSSKFLAMAMADTIKEAKDQVIVELGPGNGIITEYINQVIGDSKLFLSIELNPVMAEKTRLRCPSVNVIEGSVENLDKYLNDFGEDKASTILSSLPWVSLPEALQQRLFKATFDSLQEGGYFVYYTYIGFNLLSGGRKFSKLIEKNFADVKLSKLVIRNFPPALVYVCRKGLLSL